MIVKDIKDEDFVNYRKPAMFIAFPMCSFKCEKEAGKIFCQNSDLLFSKSIHISAEKVVERYLNNPITKAVVCGGMEPLDTFRDLLLFITELRKQSNDEVIIYTGYTEEELENGYSSFELKNCEYRKSHYNSLKTFPNIIIKFGRFVPNQKPHYDEILGVRLASDNQYARRISNES